MGNENLEKLETSIIEIMGGLETVEIALYATVEECAKNSGIAKVVELLHTQADGCLYLLQGTDRG